MRRLAVIAISVTLAAIAGPSWAESPRKPPARSADPDKLLCKTKPKTGTRFATKTCHTVAQWEVIAEENRRSFDEMQGPVINTDRGG